MSCLLAAFCLVFIEPYTSELLDFPTRELHSATMAQAKNGHLLVACYAGSEEGNDDTRIWLRRYDGKKWTPAVQITDEVRCYNPVLFQPKKEGAPLLLYYKAMGSPQNWKGFVKKSEDNGLTWSKAMPLPGTNESYFESVGSRFIGPTKNKPLELPDGMLLLGSSLETNKKWFVHIERTKDYFRDFLKQGPFSSSEIKGIGPIQPAFLVHSPDYKVLQMIVRTNLNGHAASAWSSDMGSSWTSITMLPGEVGGAGIDAITLKDNLGHVIAGSLHGERRNAIGFWHSKDGKEWKKTLTVDNGLGHREEYPSLLQTVDGKVHLVFTYRRSRIKHAIIDPKNLLPQEETFTKPG